MARAALACQDRCNSSLGLTGPLVKQRWRACPLTLAAAGGGQLLVIRLPLPHAMNVSLPDVCVSRDMGWTRRRAMVRCG
jgi:hypothetical protein